MTHEHTPSDEPLAGGNSFQNAFRQVAGHLISTVKSTPSPEEQEAPDAAQSADDASRVCHGHDFDLSKINRVRPSPFSLDTSNPMEMRSPSAPSASSSQDLAMTTSITTDISAAQDSDPIAPVVQCIPEHVVEAIHALHSAPEHDPLGDELASLSERSHAPSPARVDLTRLQRHEQTKAVHQQQAAGNKKPRNPPARPPAAPKPIKAQPLMQSEKSRNYLRQAMQTAVTNEDGVDHINTSSSAETRLGQALEINAHIPFHHPDLGPFKSVGGLWYFIGGHTQDETFRSLFGKACRMQGKSTKMREIQGFKTIIAEATWIKVFSDEGLRQAMTASALPFRCYYLQGEMSLRVAALTEDWYMPILEEIRRTLKAMEQTGQTDLFPDFAFLEVRRQVEKKNATPKAPPTQRVPHQRY